MLCLSLFTTLSPEIKPLGLQVVNNRVVTEILYPSPLYPLVYFVSPTIPDLVLPETYGLGPRT